MRLESECIDTPRMGGRDGGLASFSFLFFSFLPFPLFGKGWLEKVGGSHGWKWGCEVVCAVGESGR